MAPGGQLTVAGRCYAPNVDVTVTLNSNPVFLGAVRTDANGSFTARFVIPVRTARGPHTITATGSSDTASAALTVGTPGGFAVTGTNLTLTGIAVTTLFAGLVLLAGRRLGDQNDELARQI
ncbi:MAG: hypothetical protein H0W70_07715 [Actinobacteria bacterium]|nr:hypothetical protein [Actinomycetota bacterium]